LLTIRYNDSSTSGSDDFAPTPPVDDVSALLLRAVDTDGNVNNDIKEYLESRHSSPSWHYTVTDQGGYGAVASPAPYFFLAAVGNRYNAYRTTDLTSLTFPYRKTLYDAAVTPASTPYTIPMANSVQLAVNGLNDDAFSNPVIPATISNDHWNAALSSGAGAYEAVKQFGFNFLFGATNNTFDYWEDVLTVDQSFYRTGYGPAEATTVSGDSDNTYYTLDSRTLSDFPIAATSPTTIPSNTLAFRFDPRAQSYFDATGTARIPYYRLSRLKVEDATLDTGTHDLIGLKPGHTFNVNAYVYAQEGSWNIIPSIFFDENVRRDWVNSPGATASSGQDPGENLDLNRDGTTTEAEKAAVYRFYRYNYKINFKGAIMENKTAVVQNAGSGATQVTGDVADWTDKWAAVTLTAANFPGNVLDHTTVKYGDGHSNAWQTINYEFDPAAVTGASPLNADPGFNLPVTPDLIYQTG
jgi:hypothetical protein